ncbi:MAG: hypothetical protein ACMZ64_05310 [Oleiphilus sp.]
MKIHSYSKRSVDFNTATLSSALDSIKTCYPVALSLSLAVLLSACSSMKWHDYKVKDSLFVWSDEAEQTNTQSETVSAENPRNNSEVLAQANSDASDQPVPASSTQQTTAAQVEGDAKQTLILESVVKQEDLATERPNQTSETVEASMHAEVLADSALEPIQTQPGEVKNEAPSTPFTMAENEMIAASSIESVDDVNKLTTENPSAAGTPVSEVLPRANATLTETDLPKELFLLSNLTEYKKGVEEFGMWQLVKEGSPSRYNEVCTLTSGTVQLDQYDDYTTQVWFNIVGDDLLVNSTTNIDVQQAQVGVQFDQKNIQPFTKNHFRTSAVWSGNLMAALEKNKTLSIRLGGNELGRKTQEVAINLQDLKNAYSEYRICNRGTQIGSL